MSPGVPGLLTADELSRLPDDGWNHEIVEGRLVRMPLSGGGHGFIASRLDRRLGVFAEDNRLGVVLSNDAGFQLNPLDVKPDTVFGAGVAFVRAERVPGCRG
jgi:Uma2 family endonuclease